ncbi:hypothetical protein ACFQZ8_32315 [Micromonospora azadirachtae]|uniref:Uncharacterized protein n=1 Tax=Micromonospora azadirachtae TaxID=1970735 RepID=A0ABW3ACK7_9ACTN
MTGPVVTPLEPVSGDRRHALVTHPGDPEFGGAAAVAHRTGQGERVG